MDIEKDTSEASIAGADVVVVPNVELEYVPKIGDEFDSLEAAYDFYNAYARMAGFSIRKNQVRKDASKTMIVDQIFCCSMEGKRREVLDVSKVRSKAQMRCGCKAYVRIQLNNSGKYKIWALNESHNHELVPSSMSHRLRSQRRITTGQAAQANIAERAGLTPTAVINLMSTQAGGIENLGFVQEDFKYYIRTKKKVEMKKGDRGELASYFQKKLCEDRSFFQAIQLDEDDMITNIFWADGQMVADYEYFGDVVSFDTTFKTNIENRPLALFVGLNHHRHAVVFGVALLYEESADAFAWLFETFVSCMHDKAPRTIITDQDQAMAKAIQLVLPQTVHRNCIWHLYQNAAKHLSAVFHQCKGFAEGFKNCIYRCENDVEFEEAWQSLLEKFDLAGNEWLETKYREREKWSLAYGRDHFCADMLSTQLSESMNASIKNALNRQKSMVRLLEQIDIVVAKHRYNELVCDGNMILRKKEPCINQPLLRHACKVYTPAVYERVEKEVMALLSYKIRGFEKFESNEIFKIANTSVNINQEHTVIYNCENHNIECSCKKFLFGGVLCRHVFLVFYHKEIHKIPEKYILKRWRKDAKNGWQGFKYPHASSTSNDVTKVSKRYNHVCSTLVQIGGRAAASEKAMAFVMEMAKKMQEGVENILDGTIFKELPKDFEASCSNDPMCEGLPKDIDVDDEGEHHIDTSFDAPFHVDANEIGGCATACTYESHSNYVEESLTVLSTNKEVVVSQKLLEKSKGVKVKEKSKRAGMSVHKRVDALTQATRKKRRKPSTTEGANNGSMESLSQKSAHTIPPLANVNHIYHFQPGQMVPTQSMLQTLQVVEMLNPHNSSSPRSGLPRDNN